MVSAKEKEKKRESECDCWGAVRWGKLVILNRVFSIGFTKKQRPERGEGTGPADSCRTSTPGGGRANIKTQIRSKGQRCRWASAFLGPDFYSELDEKSLGGCEEGRDML